MNVFSYSPAHIQKFFSLIERIKIPIYLVKALVFSIYQSALQAIQQIELAWISRPQTINKTVKPLVLSRELTPQNSHFSPMQLRNI